MFALEIDFQDGVSQPEMILVRRPQAVVGASDFAHVAIDDMQTLGYQLRILKGAGRGFRCQPVGEVSPQLNSLLDAVYESEADLDLGVVKLHFTTLDCDLLLKEGEPPDRAGVRVLRQACALASPTFPAVVVHGAHPMVVSFAPDQPLYIGRSKRCALRLDSADISAEHARIGFESGQFWIEDLGSTNGTFVNQQQVSGRLNVAPGVPIILGREITILGVTSEEQIKSASDNSVVSEIPKQEQHYPVFLSLSELVRPARFVVQPGSIAVIGRDPSSDIWVGAPHVSRRHCELLMSKAGTLSIRDFSRNGIAYHGGMIPKGENLEIRDIPKVFDLGGGITVAICFDQDQEQAFQRSKGSFTTFSTQGSLSPQAGHEPDIPGLQTWGDETQPNHDKVNPYQKKGLVVKGILGEFLGLSKLGKIGVGVFFVLVTSILVFLLQLIQPLLS